MEEELGLWKKKVEFVSSEQKRLERQLRMEALTGGGSMRMVKTNEIKRLTGELQKLQETLQEETEKGEKETKANLQLEEKLANSSNLPTTPEGWEELVQKYKEMLKERDDRIEHLEAEEEDWMQSTNELQNLSDAAVHEVQAELEVLRKRFVDLNALLDKETAERGEMESKLAANTALIAKAQEAN